MTVPFVLMCSELSTSVRRQAGQVPYVEWLGSEAGWWHGWCHLPSPPTLRGTVGTPSRAAFFTPKQSHENERTRYLYITRNPRYLKKITFSLKKRQTIKIKIIKKKQKSKSLCNWVWFSYLESSFLQSLEMQTSPEVALVSNFFEDLRVAAGQGNRGKIREFL